MELAAELFNVFRFGLSPGTPNRVLRPGTVLRELVCVNLKTDISVWRSESGIPSEEWLMELVLMEEVRTLQGAFQCLSVPFSAFQWPSLRFFLDLHH